MANRQDEESRWAELMDRHARGEALSPEEQAFCERFAASDAAAAAEQEFYAELAHLDATPDARSRALVDAALAGLVQDGENQERRTVSLMRRDLGSRAAVAMAAAAALAAAAGLGYVAFGPSAAPEVVSAPVAPPTRVELVYASGDVRIDGRAPAQGTTLLREGSTIEVARGSACIAMDPGIDLCASGATTLKLTRTLTPWRRLDLVSGEVGVQLAPQAEGSRFSIVADGVWSTAVGTAFTVAHDGESGIRTTVLHGKVRVGNDGGQEHIVAAHQRARVRAGRADVAPVMRAEESTEWAILRPASLWREPVSATLALDGAPGTEVVLDGNAVGITPLSTLIPVGAHRLALRVDGRVALEREFVAEAGRVVALDIDWGALAIAPVPVPAVEAPAALEPRAPASATAPAPQTQRSAAQSLGEARRLLRDGRYAAAAGEYEALRRNFPASPESHTVLVPLAQIELDRLGRPERALVHLDRYLGSGQGALAQEARYARIRALASLAQTRQETAAIEEFLRLHPTSLRAARLEERLARLKAAR
jgi:hypothetical protein